MHTVLRSSRFRRFFALGALAAATMTVTGVVPVSASTVPAPARGSQVTDDVADQIAAIDADKADRSPAEEKIDSNLLYAAAEAVDGTAVDGAPGLKSSATVEGGRTEVDITATVDAALLGHIEELGGDVKASVPGFDSVRAVLPVGALEQLASDDAVRTIGAAGEAMTNGIGSGSALALGAAVGSVTSGAGTSSVGAGASQADVTHGADVVRTTYGLDGTGVKVCALSDGIGDLAGRQATGDLPAVDILPGQAGSGSEGTAMLELIHDIAPGAELGFATAFGSQAGFAQNILNLRADGCDVIVDDVIWFAEGAFQDDDVARAVSQVRADGALYFTAAGNSGNLADGTSGSWQGDFQDAGASAAPLPAGLRVHGWGAGVPYNVLTVGSSQVVTLQWADPLAASTNDYDLYILNAAGSRVVRASTSAQTGTQDPFEAQTASAGERVVVTRTSGAANRYLALYTNRGQLTYKTAGATFGHEASVDAISTAATPAAVAFGQPGSPVGPFPAQHSGSNRSEIFSSDGPSRSFFAPNGTPLTPGVFSSAGGVVRNAIDITAADGVTTTTPGFSPFFGTSAAAPDAAAVAALALSGDMTLTPGAIEAAMKASAVDIEAAGIDVTTGPGIVMAPALFAQLGIALPNTAPTTVVDSYSTPFETPLTVAAPGVLANDTDAELDPLTATVVDGVDHGSLALHPDGSLTYTPVAGFSGDDTFTYTAGDGALASVPTVVTISVARPSLSGRVTGPSGDPLGGVAVFAYLPTDGFVPSAVATSAPDGTYGFATLAAGSYALLFRAPAGTGLPAQWLGGGLRSTTPQVAIVDGSHIDHVDQHLAAPSTMSGVVLGVDGQPVVGITVAAYRVGEVGYFPSATTTTGSGGSYTLAGLVPGAYEVVFVPVSGTGVAIRWYGGNSLRVSATRLTVTSGSTTVGINTQLSAATSISGNAGGPSVTVAAYTPADTWVGSFQTTSRPDGTYTLNGLPPGTYKIAFFPPVGPTTWYGGTTRTDATSIVVTTTPITGINKNP